MNGKFYQYHNGDDEKQRLFIYCRGIYCGIYLLGWYLLLYLLVGEEVARNLLGGCDPSLVHGLAQYGPPKTNGILTTVIA